MSDSVSRVKVVFTWVFGVGGSYTWLCRCGSSLSVAESDLLAGFDTFPCHGCGMCVRIQAAAIEEEETEEEEWHVSPFFANQSIVSSSQKMCKGFRFG